MVEHGDRYFIAICVRCMSTAACVRSDSTDEDRRHRSDDMYEKSEEIEREKRLYFVRAGCGAVNMDGKLGRTRFVVVLLMLD
jgi:hypothetical protein